MANNIGLQHHTAAANLYAIMRDPTGKAVIVSSGAVETYVTANLGNYDIVGVEQGTASKWYDFPIPASTPVGTYTVAIFIRAGGSPAEGDTRAGTGSIDWDGTNISPPSVAPAAALSRPTI